MPGILVILGYMKRLLLVLVVAACGTDPVDAEGTYSVGVTNRDDACMIGWTVGQQNSGVTVVITQSGDSAVADVQGGAGFYVSLVVGTNTFSGKVNGASLDLYAAGTHPKTTGNCTYTIDGRINATLTGDALQGTISYVANTNSNSDCAAVQCTSSQDFSGSRPPR